MTDREQIIIDGVDVSRCRYFLKDTEEQDYETDEFVKGCCEAKDSYIGYEFDGYGLCRGDKDCYFKQLARKTQECEELKSSNKILADLYTNVDACLQIRTEKFDRYRKALEEIEGLVKNFCKDCGDYENCNWDKEGCYYSLIPNLKDIINKAKRNLDEK